MRLDGVWENTDSITGVSLICGHCGTYIGPTQAFGLNNKYAAIYICPNCNRPTFLEKMYDISMLRTFIEKQIPGVRFGYEVNHLPNDILSLYQQSRDCVSVGAYTSSVLSCRKLLANIAVSRGAEENLSFQKYVGYLDEKGYVPPDGKEWVDIIRKKGNEATHEISLMTKNDAEQLLTFLGMLLKFIYEFPGMLGPKVNQEQKKSPKNIGADTNPGDTNCFPGEVIGK